MSSPNYFIKEGYVNNPVETYNTSGVEEYWTKERIKVSEKFQYHVYEYALKVFKAQHLKSVLDIGAGPGTKMKHFFANVASELAIVDQPTTQAAARRVFPEATFYPANLEDATFSTGRKYDMVICSDVIEHLENPDALLMIIKNHLDYDKGIAILSTPDRELRWGKENNQSPNKQHVREWSSGELKRYLEVSGFEIISHINFPLKRLSPMIFGISRLPGIYKRIQKASWYPNQTIVMRLLRN